jgi:hypothetical protein
VTQRMGKGIRFSTILAVLAVVAVVAVYLAAVTSPFPQLPFHQRPPELIPGDIEVFYMVKTVLSTVNATLIVILLTIYIDLYVRTKAQFTVGLIIFSAVLLLNALASNPLIQFVFGFRAFGLGPFAMLPDLFTFFALIVLLYLNFKY